MKFTISQYMYLVTMTTGQFGGKKPNNFKHYIYRTQMSVFRPRFAYKYVCIQSAKITPSNVISFIQWSTTCSRLFV